MKRTAFLLTVGVGLLALGLCGTWTANGQEPADALRLLQAENTLLKATMKQRDKEIESLKKEVESSKALTTTLLEKLRVKSGIATTPPVAGPTTPESATQPQAKQGADQDKWAGFRGLKWGTNIANAPGMVLTEEDGDNKFYRREDDNLAIGEAKLEAIIYGFYKGRFSYLSVRASGLSNWVCLRDATFAMYGQGDKTNRFIERWYWYGGKPLPSDGVFASEVFMILEYSEITEKSKISMSGPLRVEEKADKAKIAKEAKKDF
jgi:hypothetical protein